MIYVGWSAYVFFRFVDEIERNKQTNEWMKKKINVGQNLVLYQQQQQHRSSSGYLISVFIWLYFWGICLQFSSSILEFHFGKWWENLGNYKEIWTKIKTNYHLWELTSVMRQHCHHSHVLKSYSLCHDPSHYSVTNHAVLYLPKIDWEKKNLQ